MIDYAYTGYDATAATGSNKYRIASWLDMKKRALVFVIECKTPTSRKYRGMRVDGEPMVFDEKSEADAVLRDLRECELAEPKR